jgi:hypothetical protein
MGRLLNRLKAIFESPDSIKPAILFFAGNAGFSVQTGPGTQTEVHFSDVKEIFAFKRDMFSVDLICLGFRTSEDGSYCEVSEEMSGYEELLGLLNERFGIKLEDWFSKVAFPAFETKLTTIWGQSRFPI